MGRFMLPILILTTVALSLSDVLPMLSDKDNIPPFNIGHQEDDNIFSNIVSNEPNDIFYNRPLQDNYISLSTLKEITNSMYYKDTHVNNLNENLNKDKNYDYEGFRKEQWHNYPRQLDRLHNSQYRHGNSDADESVKSKSDDAEPINGDIADFTANEFRLDSSDGDRNVYDTIVAATNPILILKIQLAYLRDSGKKYNLNDFSNLLSIPLKSNKKEREEDNKSLSKVIQPAVKVKREKPNKKKDNEISDEDSLEFEIGSYPARKTVKKRLFSLWSRLQSLSHRGHELHHRRHLHAFYGLPDNIGNRNGIMTAQTRATFVRPPGSPLRWG